MYCQYCIKRKNSDIVHSSHLTLLFFSVHMLVFIVPLKSRTVSKSWARVSSLFERTARSICAQTVNDFRLIVVCNEMPETDFSHPNMEFIKVDIFPTESTVDWINRGREDDKARRIMAGMAKANEYNPSYVMVVDADDCIRNNLVEYVLAQPKSRGWYVDSGYVYKPYGKFLYKKNTEFQKLCGSSLILIPKDVFRVITIDSHGHVYHHQSQPSEEIPLKPLPFPSAIYTVLNQENHHMTTKMLSTIKTGTRGSRIKNLIRRIRIYRVSVLTNSTRKLFGLYPV